MTEIYRAAGCCRIRGGLRGLDTVWRSTEYDARVGQNT